MTYNKAFFTNYCLNFFKILGSKQMEKQAKRERKLAEKKAKRLAKEGPKKTENKDQTLDPNKPISLDFLTNPNKE